MHGNKQCQASSIHHDPPIIHRFTSADHQSIVINQSYDRDLPALLSRKGHHGRFVSSGGTLANPIVRPGNTKVMGITMGSVVSF